MTVGERKRPMGRAGDPVRVCIVYEHSLFAHGLRRLFEREKAFRVVGMIKRPLTSSDQLRHLRPDVVIVEGDGRVTVLETLEGAMGVVVSLKGEDAAIFTGRPIKVSGPEELVETVRTIAGKKRGWDVARRRTWGRLTRRMR